MEYLGPYLSLPLVEIVLSVIAFGIPLAILVDPLASELLKALVDEFTNEIELLVRAVTKAKHCIPDALEQPRVFSLVFAGIAEPSEEFLRVVAGIPLVVGRRTDYHQRMLRKHVILEFLKVKDSSRALYA